MSGEVHTKVIERTEADDSSELEGDVIRLFNSFMSEMLDMLSSRFPHVKGDGSDNEVEFLGLRSKVLRAGNNRIRELPNNFQDFKIVKVFETKIEKIAVDTPYKIKVTEQV